MGWGSVACQAGLVRPCPICYIGAVDTVRRSLRSVLLQALVAELVDALP